MTAMTPSEPGGYVGDIFFGNPDNPTQGTHRWDGSEWAKLPSEQVALLELLVGARVRVEKLEDTAKDLNAAIDAMWNEGPTSDPEVHRLAITRAQQDLRLALEGDVNPDALDSHIGTGMAGAVPTEGR